MTVIDRHPLKRRVPFMRESEVEQYLRKRVENMGGLCLKFVSPGQAGVPDRLILFRGVCVFIETKAPAEQARPLQDYQMARIMAQGFPCWVIDTKQKVDSAVAYIRAAAATKPSLPKEAET